MKALEGLKEVSAFLNECGIADSQKEAELIVSDYLGVERVVLYRDNPLLSAEQQEKMGRVLERRHEREPLQYITGFVDFYGLEIRVGPGVLIPRPETELLVSEAIKAVTHNTLRETSEDNNPLRVTRHALRILDLCTGTGCIAFALAKEIPDSCVIGTDLSEQALEYALMNTRINGITNASFMKGNLFEPVAGLRFDLVVSNPPYIKREEIGGLSPEIRKWEPLTALDGGKDGLRFYREILAGTCDHLADEGSLIMELGQGQAGAVTKMAEDAGLKTVSVVKDFSGIERILHLKRTY